MYEQIKLQLIEIQFLRTGHRAVLPHCFPVLPQTLPPYFNCSSVPLHTVGSQKLAMKVIFTLGLGKKIEVKITDGMIF